MGCASGPHATVRPVSNESCYMRGVLTRRLAGRSKRRTDGGSDHHPGDDADSICETSPDHGSDDDADHHADSDGVSQPICILLSMTIYLSWPCLV